MKIEFKADRIYNIFAIVPTVEIYTLPKGIWHKGSQGIGIGVRWGFWAVGVRIYKG